MPKPTDDLSALFRSLEPDDSSFQATETHAAPEAAQRGSLFQAVSPRKPETTPTLSVQERQRRSHQEQHEGGERKPALSLPGLNDKMARSLGKMSGRTADAPVKNPVKRTEPDVPPVAPPCSSRSVPQMTTMETESPLFIATPKASPTFESQRSGSVLFGSVAGGSVAPGRVASETAQADDSLAGIFSRLEGKPETISKPTDKKSSFLRRLGKL